MTPDPDNQTNAGQANAEQTDAERMAQDLSTFAIDRTDLKELIRSIPENHNLNLTTVEYELSILKILAAGWGISFYMPAGHPEKADLANAFWTNIQEISRQISLLTATTTGKQIDYFDILKSRLNDYMAVMQANPQEVTDPTQVIGPAFADACNSGDNAVAILVGAKMFTLTMGAVKEYIDAIEKKNREDLN